MIGRKLRFGMVGGGRDAFIGAVHRAAACMDGEAELLAGAFSSDARRAKDSAAALAVPSERAYGSFAEMVAAETAMPEPRRLDFIVIVTPNDQHFAPAKSFLESGFNVVIEKPVAFDLDEALRLRAIVSASGKVFVLTHAYTGHAMVRQARDLVRDGELGAIRKVIVEYSQGWLSEPLEASGHKQALWRTDPRRSGAGGSIGDIGTHAAHLSHYITGLRIEALAADLSSFVKGRRLDDDASMLIRYQGGAKGVLHCSQVSVGEENDLNIRVYGEKAALEWRQEHPDQLILKYADRPRAIWSRASPYTSAAASRLARVPPGHPEGYLEAFANIYREAFRAIRAGLEGKPVPPDCDFPTIDDGVDGMRFIEAALESARLGSAWVRFGK